MISVNRYTYELIGSSDQDAAWVIIDGGIFDPNAILSEFKLT